MGNYGNTVDRWYHRAAVVLWPRAHSFALRAQRSADWAVGEVNKHLKAGDLAAAQQMAQSLLPFWAGVARTEENPGFAARVCQVAAALEAPDQATALLEPLRLEQLTPKTAPGLRALAEAYGPAWHQPLLQTWDESRFDRSAWLQQLPELCRRLSTGAATALAQELVSRQCAWIRQQWQAGCAWPHPAQRLGTLAGLAEATVAVLESSLITKQTKLRTALLDFLKAAPTGSPVLGLTRLLHAAHEAHAGEALASLGLTGLHKHCAQVLRRRLDEPPRAQDDWSIPTRLACSCALCQQLKQFLGDGARQDMEWPLAQQNRAHVHREIDAHDLPMTHTTRRVGRPYLLVLKKTAALFKREAVERRTWATQLRWLEKTAGAFGN